MKLKIVRVSMITFMVNKPLFHKRAKKMKQFLIIMYMLMKGEAVNGEQRISRKRREAKGGKMRMRIKGWNAEESNKRMGWIGWEEEERNQRIRSRG